MAKYVPYGNIYGVDNGNFDTGDLIIEIDPESYEIIDTITATASGETIEKILGIAFNQVDQKFYALFRLSGYSGMERHLGTVDVTTGVVTIIGNLGDAFSAITFAPNGVLYGVTGDGASNSETLYVIDTTDASLTLITALGQGGDGEQIEYNFEDGLIYHWSGNGPTVIETINPNTYALNTTPLSGYDPDEEIVGSLYLADNTFLLMNRDDEFVIMTPNGFSTQTSATFPDYFRGMAQAYIYGEVRILNENTVTTKKKIPYRCNDCILDNKKDKEHKKVCRIVKFNQNGCVVKTKKCKIKEPERHCITYGPDCRKVSKDSCVNKCNTVLCKSYTTTIERYVIPTFTPVIPTNLNGIQ